MPLQTVFRDKVSEQSSTQLYPLGTLRVEGGKVYRYVLADGAIAANVAVYFVGRNEVKTLAAGFVVCGIAVEAKTDNYYFWLQVAGEYGPIDTSAAASAGVAPSAHDDTGVVSGTAVGANQIAIGNSIVTFDNASGYINIQGLL